MGTDKNGAQVAMALVNKGLALGEDGRHEEAIEAYEEVVPVLRNVMRSSYSSRLPWLCSTRAWRLERKAGTKRR